MSKQCFIDGDSIAYAGGHVEHPSQMEMCVDAYINEIREATGCDKPVGFVENPDGKANFRKYVAVTKGYKSNRADKVKPPFMVDAKRYLHSKHGFSFVTYMESEDACSISAHSYGLHNSVIACIDKDLYQIPATFYDYRRKQTFSVSYDEAEYNLYKQILMGDATDAITGIPGMGEVKAEAALKDVPTAALAHHTAGVYKQAGYNYEYLLEQSRLIYILRRRGEVFTPCSRSEWEAIQCV